MFQEFYGFWVPPFSRSIPTTDLFPSTGHQEIKARLTYLLWERGIGLVTGEVGSGKSTALRAFAEGLDPNRYLVIYPSLRSRVGSGQPRSGHDRRIPGHGHCPGPGARLLQARHGGSTSPYPGKPVLSGAKEPLPAEAPRPSQPLRRGPPPGHHHARGATALTQPPYGR